MSKTLSKSLVVLGLDGAVRQMVEGPAPFDEVRFLDCKEGETGTGFVYSFYEDWRGLLEQYFGADLPDYVIVNPIDDDGPDGEEAMAEYAASQVATLMTSTIYLKKTPGGQILLRSESGLEDDGLFGVGESGAGQGAVAAPRPESEQSLIERIERDIIALRKLAVDPFELRLDEQGLIRVEINPLDSDDRHDQRVLVCHRDMGYVSVRYEEQEGLFLDAYDCSDDLKPVFETRIRADDLLTWNHEQPETDAPR